MNESTGPGTQGCGDLQALIVWYPTAQLDPTERRRVEAHVAECASCADLLHFANDLQDTLQASAKLHPQAEELVQFVEDAGALEAVTRGRIEQHLAACLDCREQAAILAEVDQELASTDAVRELAYHPRATRGLLERIWNRLATTVLQPIPAASYLVAAVAAVVVIAVHPWETTSPGTTGAAAGARRVLLTDVRFLAGAGETVRGEEAEPTGLPVLEGARAEFLVLELTGIAAPPAPEELFRVEIRSAAAASPVWSSTVQAGTFLEDYSLGVLLEPGALAPGRYALAVISPAGELVFRAALEIR